MNLRPFAVRATAVLLLLGGASCPDLTLEPKSEVTEANVFTDVGS